MNVEWQNPNVPPIVNRGETVKVWALIESCVYDTKWGGLDDDGKATRTSTLKSRTARVVELHYGNVSATPDEIAYMEEHGEFPDSAPARLDEWLDENGEFHALHGFYREYPDEGGMCIDAVTEISSGQFCINSGWYGEGNPEIILLAWAEFEKPPVPERFPDFTIKAA